MVEFHSSLPRTFSIIVSRYFLLYIYYPSSSLSLKTSQRRERTNRVEFFEGIPNELSRNPQSPFGGGLIIFQFLSTSFNYTFETLRAPTQGYGIIKFTSQYVVASSSRVHTQNSQNFTHAPIILLGIVLNEFPRATSSSIQGDRVIRVTKGSMERHYRLL